MASAAPAKYPCASCPYRRDVASGVWSPEEYAKLPPYDNATWGQPPGAFFCHQQNGRLCAGWVGCHDMQESLGMRLAVSTGLSIEDYEAALSYTSPVPLFDSGAEAAAHGMAEVPAPGPKAQRTIRKIEDRRQRRGGSK
jgi:hypothetical protein